MKALIIARRELASYFYSPISWVVMTLFLVATGYEFWILTALLNGRDAPHEGGGRRCGSGSSSTPGSSFQPAPDVHNSPFLLPRPPLQEPPTVNTPPFCKVVLA